MKVILLKDVAKIGKKFEIKDVSDGHALNFLMPRGLAEVASDKNVAKIDLLKKQANAEKQIQEDLLMKNLKSLEGLVVTIKEKANDKGHLFAGIHKTELIPEIKKQTELDMSAEHIDLDKPIKAVGEYDIHVHVQDKKASFKLVVEAL